MPTFLSIETFIILVVVGVLAVAGLIAVLILREKWKTFRRQRLLETGGSGQARVLFMEQTGVFYGARPPMTPAVDILLEVHPEPHPSIRDPRPFQVTRRIVLPLSLLSKVQPGAFVPVKFDLSNPNRLAIDFGEAGAC